MSDGNKKYLDFTEEVNMDGNIYPALNHIELEEVVQSLDKRVKLVISLEIVNSYIMLRFIDIFDEFLDKFAGQKRIIHETMNAMAKQILDNTKKIENLKNHCNNWGPK